MKQQIKTLGTLREEIMDRAKSSIDVIRNTQQLGLSPTLRLVNTDKKADGMPLNPVAERQFAAYLGIPTAYWSYLKEKRMHSLLADNVTQLLHQENENRLIRVQRGSVRAFLSDRFSALDNIDVFRKVLDLLVSDDKQWAGASFAVTDEAMHIKVLSPKLFAHVAVGDAVRFGAYFSNSEVGLGKLSVRLFCERLRCTNGMTIEVPGLTRSFVHLGSRTNNKSVLDRRWAMIRDEMKQAVGHITQPREIKRLTDTMTAATAKTELDGSPAEIMKRIGKRLALTEDEQALAAKHLVQTNEPLSRWSLANAITRTAADVDSYDRASELEAAGGRLIFGSISLN